MYPGFGALLSLTVEQLSKGEIILIEDNNTDGSFLLHHFISSFLRGNGNVCIVGFAQTLVHYSSIGKKLGINLNSAKESNQLIYVDGMKMLLECLQDESSEPLDLKRLFSKIKLTCETLGEKPSLLVIDNLNFLINAGVDAEKVADFMHYCCSLAKSTDNQLCMLSLLHCNSDLEDDDAIYLRNQLKYHASIQISVKGLETGYSRDVHGEVKVKRRHSTESHIITPATKIMQYKLNDKGVDFFPLGTSAAVL